MYRLILFAIVLIPAGLAFVACDEETVAPPIDEPPAPLLEGAWTLRVRPDPELYDPFLIPGTFTTVADTVFFSTPQGDFRGEATGRSVSRLSMYWEDGSWSWLMTLGIDVARDGGTLTGTFETAVKIGDSITGTVFGAPGDEIPEIAVELTPSQTSIPMDASLNFMARVTGYHDRHVSWNLEPEGFGTLSASGRYTAPAIAPESTEVRIMAASEVDIGARDTATVRVEVPPVEPICDFVHGNWGIQILVEGNEGSSEDWCTFRNWTIVQDGCGLRLYDDGMVVDLDMTGRYAYGTHQVAAMTQYTYTLFFHNGVQIIEGSSIQIINLIDPSQTYTRLIRGNKTCCPKNPD